MLVRDDTIAALSTPAGRGAIAIVRLSGGAAHRTASMLVRPWPAEPRRVVLCTVRDPVDDSVIDQALVTRFDAPHSFTGEAMVEIACHGGITSSSAIMQALTRSGIRTAEAGEFTQRAVLNGKLDLLQAEAIGDLVDARTHALRRAAVLQLTGGLTRVIADLRERMLHVEALLAYDIDFPEEDDGPIARETIALAVVDARESLSQLLTTVPLGEVARDGALIVIAGAPNAGKSSLFNALLGETRSIVTDIPGTTRDAIEAHVESGRWPLRLVDTAGLRATSDFVERLGIEVSERHVRSAHIILACAETQESLQSVLAQLKLLGTAPCIGVLTKSDLHRRQGLDRSSTLRQTESSESSESSEVSASSIGGTAATPLARSTVAVSVETREGLDRLLAEIHSALEENVGDINPESPIVTRTRHQRALELAAAELDEFLHRWRSREVPAAVASVHIRSATHQLDELIGSVDVDDVLARVFASFCVGK